MQVTFDVKEYKEKIIPIIKQKNGLVSSGDVAVETGFPLVHIKYVLNMLAAEYLAEITVTDSGDLIYKFNPALTKNKFSFSRMMDKFFKWLYKIFVILFKFSIMLTLIGYTIFYILIIIALAVGLSAASKGKNNKSFDLVLVAFRILIEMFIRFFIFYKNPYDKYEGVAKRPFYIKVFSFVFGDDNKQPPFNHDKNILHYLKEHKTITLAKAVNMTGLSEEETRKILLEMTVKYEGNIEVNDDGVIYYIFENLTFTDETKKPILHSWDRLLPIPKLNYNETWDNVKIIALNVFNLIMSGIFVNVASRPDFNAGLETEAALLKGVFIYGLVFSTLFFVIPVIRKITLKYKVQKVELYNAVLNKLKELYTNARINNETMLLNKSEEPINKYLFNNYSSLVKRDFINDNEVINAKIYTQEIVFDK